LCCVWRGEANNYRSTMSFQVFFHNCNEQLQNEVKNAIEEFKDEAFELNVKSSGSTGTPKQIVHSKQAVIASALRTNRFFQLTENSRVLCPLAIHTIGAKMALFRAIVGNYQLHFVEASRDFIKVVPSQIQFDLVSLAVIQFAELLENNMNDFGRFNNILLGGSAIPIHLEEKSIQFQLKAFIGFGMTETLSHIALRKLGNENYQCLDGISVESSTDGMLIHLNDNTITSTDIIETTDKEHFKWIGRNDFIINSGGVKISPELLENAVNSVFDVKIVVVGISDVTYGQKAILVSETNIDEQLKIEIKSFIEERFGKYHVPKEFLVHEFGYINGLKLDRLGLIKSVEALYE